MDFFTSQDRARRNTGVLVALYAAAVIGVVVAVYAVIWFAFLRIQAETGQLVPFWQPKMFFTVCGITLAVVGLGTAFKLMELRAGGAVVAKSLGGRLLDRSSRDPLERKLLNVVDEMAIASGMTVPDVYLLDHETRINAFAAGHRVDQAALGFTRGCVEKLSRDELQGVVAHEFSHVLHGDMRLNLRLVGVLHGILVIGLIGSTVLRLGFYTSGGRRSSDGRGKLALIGLGIALWIIGSIGTMFGRLIQAAVSRQREFLADASAVAYTRDPGCISGALQQIGASAGGAQLKSSNTAEFRHMYFGAGMSEMFAALATHPPLDVRIRRVDPSWDGSFPEPRPGKPPPAASVAEKKTAPRQPTMQDILGAGVLAGGVGMVGRPTQDHLNYARELLQRIPKRLIDGVQTVFGARAVICSLIMDRERNSRVPQLAYLASRSEDLRNDVVNYTELLERAGAEVRLTLIDLALPALRQMNRAEYAALFEDVNYLMRTDGIIDPFEWVLGRMLRHHLEPKFEPRRKSKPSVYAVEGKRAEVGQLLTQIARMGQAGDTAQRAAFDAGVSALGDDEVAMAPSAECTLPALDAAVDGLMVLASREKRKVLDACAATIAADGKVTVHEGELLRGIADVLDCPMPPLLPGMKV